MAQPAYQTDSRGYWVSDNPNIPRPVPMIDEEEDAFSQHAQSQSSQTFQFDPSTDLRPCTPRDIGSPALQVPFDLLNFGSGASPQLKTLKLSDYQVIYLYLDPCLNHIHSTPLA